MGWCGLSGQKVFTVDAGSRIEECLAIVKSSLGEGFDHLCNIRIQEIDKYPVLGWVVTLRPSLRQGEEGKMIVNARPIFFSQTVEERDAVLFTELSLTSDKDYLDAQIYEDTIDKDEKVVGVLPSWPNTYYVTGHVNGIAFSLGVHINPSNEELIELLLKAYLDWLKGPEVRRFKDKLAEPKNKPER
jgi:hypothetical protein